ncbi:transposase [Labilithrix luteola]|uniref:transposase n=1 Tax=Labilithrix luteola TaxID=1391654 RepID=UPI003B835723
MVTFVQRFGSSLNPNVHFHVVVLDGIYVRKSDGELGFMLHSRPTEQSSSRFWGRFIGERWRGSSATGTSVVHRGPPARAPRSTTHGGRRSRRASRLRRRRRRRAR